MDDLDRQLLSLLQKGVPVQPRPFEAVGKKTGLHGADVILRILRLKQEKGIRQISGIFDIHKINYQSTLVTMRLPEESVDQVAAAVTAHPGVSRCSKLNGEWNLWFALALPSKESLEGHLQRLEEISGAEKTLALKALKVYKPAEVRTENAVDLTEIEIQAVRAIQEDFPLTDEPYKKIAAPIGQTEEQVLKELQGFQKRGFLKRIAAPAAAQEKPAPEILVLWQIPEEKRDWAARKLAAFPEISSCVQRTAYEELPYTLYTTLKGVAEVACIGKIYTMEETIGQWPHHCFFKEKDYKKSRLKYFAKEIEDWKTTSHCEASEAGRGNLLF